ncbi:MAG: hypothetical protein J5713_01295 [Clostridia bacterium]|nr:hypothetical protein [Clostridia bacterium]
MKSKRGMWRMGNARMGNALASKCFPYPAVGKCAKIITTHALRASLCIVNAVQSQALPASPIQNKLPLK